MYTLFYEFSTVDQIADEFARRGADGVAKQGLLFAVFPQRLTKTFYVLVSIRDLSNPDAEGLKRFVTDGHGSILQYADVWSCLAMIEDLSQSCGLSSVDRSSVLVQVRF